MIHFHSPTIRNKPIVSSISKPRSINDVVVKVTMQKKMPRSNPTKIQRNTCINTEELLYRHHYNLNNLRHTYSRHPAFSSHKTIYLNTCKQKSFPKSTVSTTMLNPTQPTLREAAIQAAAAKNLESFSKAYTPNPTQAGYIAKAMSKACNQLARTTNVCNNGLVKQLCFIQANNKLAILSCPFPTQGPDGEAIIAGSLGDSFDVICPISIRLRDARGLVVSIVTPKDYAVDTLDLPTSKTNPLEEEGPPPKGRNRSRTCRPGPNQDCHQRSVKGALHLCTSKSIPTRCRIHNPKRSNQEPNHYRNSNPYNKPPRV